MVIFIYHDIRWGERAQIGFNAGDGYTSFTLPEALSSQTLSIDRRSNVGEPGVFAYRIDGTLFITDLKNNYGHPIPKFFTANLHKMSINVCMYA